MLYFLIYNNISIILINIKITIQLEGKGVLGDMMEFRFETDYNTETMTVMARALRKTIRSKKSRRSYIFGWIVTILGLLLAISDFALDFSTIVTLAAALTIFLVLIFEDRINGYAAKKRLLKGTETAETVFTESGFVSTTGVGKSEWNYDKIEIIAETKDFFVFIFSMNHAQLYDKKHLQGGTVDEFRTFIESVTDKKAQRI